MEKDKSQEERREIVVVLSETVRTVKGRKKQKNKRTVYRLEKTNWRKELILSRLRLYLK